MSLTSSQKHVVAAIAAMVILLVASVAIGTWLIDKRDNAASSAITSTPVSAPTPPTEVRNTASSPDANQPCNYLDYEGNPKDPDRIILWCDAGQTALVINTKSMKAGDPSDPSDASGDHDLDVRAGKHYAWHLTIVKQDDGSIDFRVWYDDQKETKDAEGDTVTQSRVTMRNFTIERLAQTRSLGYN